jgi:N-acetylmuramic acid 6-phosphate etherase
MAQETAGTQRMNITPEKDQASLLQELTTESQNEASQGFDTKSALEIARIINHEDAKIAGAVKKALPEIAQVIDQVTRSFREGGRLIYIGAGSSGRIAALDASECPPTYSTVPGQVQYIMAGGPKALASAVEVNEDSEELGQRDIARRRPTRKDVIVGVSASGRTPYVVAAVAYARARGAHTAAVTCNHDTPLVAAADLAIIADVGPEVICGSTRMKAATSQKMILNMITTGAMTRMGYVYENLMVNVHMQNSKLVERGIRLLMIACKISRAAAVETIKCAGRSVPVALVMLKAKVDKPSAAWQDPTAMCAAPSRTICWTSCRQDRNHENSRSGETCCGCFFTLLIRRLNAVRVPHPFPRLLRKWMGSNVTVFLPHH